ncbi:MAG: glycosyltransferase family 4 protein [Clostridia bacterium]|nr:glycosyltransferase family 4 protein [Clostridia bacterium]
MKILFFITSSMEKPSPSWHLMKALLEDTLAAGFEVHAIQRHFSDSDAPPFPESILNHKNFTYSEINDKTVDRRAFVKRYLNGISYARKAKKYIKAHNDFDLAFVQSAPTSLFYLSVVRRFAKKRPVIYNSQDMFPGSAVANGSMPRKWMQKIFYWLQKKAYKKADIITAISEDMKEKLMEQGVSEEKIRVIVNWYDDAAVKEIPWEENRFVKNEGLSPDKFYVQYAGTMGTNFDPDAVLDTAERLKEYEGIEFQMIGSGVRRAGFEKKARERGLDNVVFYPLQPQELVPDVYSACSVCIIPLKRGVIGNSVPSKAGLLMACRRVIVNSVDAGSDYGEMFEREKMGFSSDIGDSEKLARDILFLYENPEVRETYANNAKSFGEREYSRTVNTKKYTELFEELTKR